MSLKTEATNYAFGGVLYKYSHAPSSLKTKEAKFNVFLPPKAFHDKKPVPVLYYLAGLTCTEDNGPQKGAFLGPAAKNNIALVFPDTSPRGADIEGEDKDWDFGTGAGFYITATKAPYSQHYNMYEYVTSELPKVIKDAGLPIDTSKASIFGHSMGGHGALTLYLKNPSLYKSASAFAPITNPTKCPWGEKAFGGYLKGGVEEGKQHDATEIIKSLDASRKLHILIDQGKDDQFYTQKQLLPENFEAAVKSKGFDDVTVRYQPGDHSYYTISTYAEDHINFHAKFLQ